MHVRGNQRTSPICPQGGPGTSANVRFDICFDINQALAETERHRAGCEANPGIIPEVNRLESL